MEPEFKLPRSCRIASIGIALVSALILGIAYVSAAATPKLTSHVNDYANVLSVDVKHQLETKLAAVEKTGDHPQIVVLTINSLEGDNIDDFTNQVFHEWKLGQKDKDNGVLTVVAVQDRKIRIEVGYGLEPTVTDQVSHEIINSIKPLLKKGSENWNAAISSETDSLINKVSNH